MKQKWLVPAIFLAGISYLIAISLEITPIYWVLKPLPILLIMILVFTTDTSERIYKYFVLAGLFFSMLGDIFLLLPEDSGFMFGLGSFLIAHLLYIPAFIKRFRFRITYLIFAAMIILFSMFFASFLRIGIMTNFHTLWIPVVIYSTVITIMLISAIFSGNRVALLGAVLFFLSDSILAWGKFMESYFWSSYAIMIFYYLGQFFIAKSVDTKEKYS